MAALPGVKNDPVLAEQIRTDVARRKLFKSVVTCEAPVNDALVFFEFHCSPRGVPLMKHSKRVYTTVAGLIAITLLSGCSTLRSQPTTSSLVVTYAASKVIEAAPTPDERLRRAQRIKSIVGEARTWLQGEGMTVELLESAARNRLATLNLSPADAMLATALVQIAVQDLQEKIGAGVVSPDQLVTVNQLLDWIDSAAKLYGA